MKPLNVSVNAKRLLEHQGSQVNLVVMVSKDKIILQVRVGHRVNLVSLTRATDQVAVRHTRVTDQPDRAGLLIRAIEITTDQVSKIEMLHQADLKKSLQRKRFKIRLKQHLPV
ncbi:hypothetical protein D3C85_1235450 [compost metagenome]